MNKQLKKLIANNTTALKGSKQDFEAIFDITFAASHHIMAEDNDGYRIHKYTYGQVKQMAEEAAGGIYRAVGETHQYIGLDMANSVNWIAAFWGILKSGNKPYLINSLHPAHLTQSILQRLNITTVICDKAGSLEVTYLPFASLEKSCECPARFENEFALATSATSLNETICFYTGQNIAAQLLNTGDILRQSKRMAKHYKGSIKQLAFLPFYHIFGLFAVYFWFSFYNRTFVFLKDLAPDTILDTCRAHQVTHIFAVPLLWHTIEQQVLKTAQQKGLEKKLQKGIRLCTKLQNAFPYLGATLAKTIMSSVTDQLFGRSVQFCISGGSFIRPSALELMNGMGYPLHNGYGMSEIGIASVELDACPRVRNLGLIGKPLSSMEYRIDEDGQLLVQGKSMCDRRQKGEQILPTDGWFATGDLVEQTASGAFRLIGRLGDVFIGDNGENINPDDLEPLFFQKEAIAYSVLSLPANDKDELCLVMQASPYTTQSTLNQIYQQLKQVNHQLPLPQQIHRFYVTDDPIMASGAIKVSRAYLRRGVVQGTIHLASFEESLQKEATQGNPLTEKVTQIVAEILQISKDSVPPTAHILYDLGGSSLQYFAILSALSDEFGITADDSEQYTYTVQEFCEYIERHL